MIRSLKFLEIKKYSIVIRWISENITKMLEGNEDAGPSKKPRYTVYLDRWHVAPEYSNWIQKKDQYTALCKLCQTEILIKYEGSWALNRHMKTKKHAKIVLSQKMSGSILNFTVSAETTIETQIARAELLCVFHNVLHGLSYNSLDCQMKMSSTIYSDSKIANKITCGRTKSAAITRNVLGPYSQEKVSKALKECWYYSVSSDASNIGNVKTYPYAVQYFDPETGIRKQILDFYEDPDETSKDIFSNIIRITNVNKLKIEQITSYSADNANVNYGLYKSVFQKLKNENSQIIKANCNCHVINNCIKNALNALTVDVENIVIKIYNEFSSSAGTTKKLKQCFEFANIEYKNLLRHVPTRWLSLLPAIDRLLYCWPAVKRYFLQKGKKNCRKVLWEFVAHAISDVELTNEDDECTIEGLSEVYLYFIHNVMHEFQAATLVLESDSCTIVELHNVMANLMNSIQSRMNDNFYGSKVATIMKFLSPNEISTFKFEANEFLKRATSYLAERYDFGETSMYNQISCLNIKKSLLTWNKLLELPKLLGISNDIDSDKLYADYCVLRQVYDILPKDIPNDRIWSYFLKKCAESNLQNLKKLISFVFSIPISNAFCEKAFSVLNNLYTKDRNRMSFDLIKAELLIRINFNEDCKNFQNFLTTPDGRELINSVSNNTKYMWQKK